MVRRSIIAAAELGAEIVVIHGDQCHIAQIIRRIRWKIWSILNLI